MFFLFWLGSDVKEERRPGGFFPCPRCGTTQPCDVVRLKRTTKLYSLVPVWTSTLAETRVCQVCGASERGIAQPAPGAGTWHCSGCGNVNPAGAPECLRCRRAPA